MKADADDGDTEIDRMLAANSLRNATSTDEGKEDKEDAYNDDDQSMAGSQHKKRHHNDSIDAADLRSHNATISQRVDSAFFSSMRISRKMLQSTSRDPLRIAIFSRDEIDLQMILDELGPNATKSILARDSEGCTALHLAALSKSPRIVTMLLNSYRIYEGRVMNADLRILNEEYQQTIRKVLL
jgi:Ankyrin repeat